MASSLNRGGVRAPVWILVFLTVAGCPAPKAVGPEDGGKQPADLDAKGRVDENGQRPRDVPDLGTNSTRPLDSDAQRWARVQVFYATDRVPAASDSFLKIYFGYWPAWICTVLTLGLAGWLVLGSRRLVVAVAMLLSLVAAIHFTYKAALRAQRQLRIVREGQQYYGFDRHEEDHAYVMEFGTCEVSIPPDHRVGRLESPSILRLDLVEDPSRHIVVQRVTRLEGDAFFQQLGRCIDESVEQQTLIFIHGYNVAFDKAVRRTAQIAFDLEFDGAPICYTWPSKGVIPAYTHDEANADWTIPHLAAFLNRVASATDARRIHIIAHSMGNRSLVEALELMTRDPVRELPIFDQIIMAAPDIDASDFRDRYAATVTSMARHVTLYASSYDKALQASTEVHGHTRAGLSGKNLVLVPGLDTVDVSPLDTSLLGHSYYGNNPLMIRDLRALIELGTPASGREWLEKKLREASLAYWVFREGLVDSN